MVLHPSYFLDLISLYHLYHADRLILEVHDSYVKQTYRNRCYIAAANGKLALNIPIIHEQKKDSVAYGDIRIDHSQPWATNHLKSIKSAYQSSPYYEYYEDELVLLFSEIPEKLMDWNIKTMGWLFHHLQIVRQFEFTTSYEANSLAEKLITAKRKPDTLLPDYIQVFQERYGFVYPLSSLDLLFNLGPAARVYLANLPKPLYG